jgi:hypothetical protein
VLKLLECVYYTNHLIEFNKPRNQIVTSSLKTVKAAKEVHQIGSFEDLTIKVGKGKKKIFPNPSEFRSHSREVEDVAASAQPLPSSTSGRVTTTSGQPSTSAGRRVTRSSSKPAPTAQNAGPKATPLDWEKYRAILANKKKNKDTIVEEGKAIRIPSPINSIDSINYI